MKVIPYILFLFMGTATFSQTYTWTGKAGDSDFYNSLNWEDSVTSQNPPTDAFRPVIKNLKLVIDHSAPVIVAGEGLKLEGSSVRIKNAELSTAFIHNGKVTVGNKGYLTLTGNTPLDEGINIDLVSGIGWVKIINMNPDVVYNNHMDVFRISNLPASYPENLRIDNYYSQGSIVRSNQDTHGALTIYDEPGFKGSNAVVGVHDVYSGDSIPDSFNNRMISFRLKKGYMVTFADHVDGTGISKNYIASENDLEVAALPVNLQENISFIRVLPWNWVSKKGIGGNVTGLDETWQYNWSNTGISSLLRENVPMAWGKGGADDPGDIALYKSKYKTTHVLAFNESDDCNGQSGQYGDLCNTEVAVATYQNLMKTGLRLVSPSGRENAPFGWLKEFYEKATAMNIRIDVIGVHWYDWGSNPANSPNADPQQVFQRFKNYLQKVYDLYGLPIWITEFNANPNRTSSVNLAFMKLALPYLEELDYVERYAWFQPNSGVADYYADDGNYTGAGMVYKNQQSSPSVSEAVYSSPNNLDKIEYSPIVFEDNFEQYGDGQNLSSIYTVWEGVATAVDDNQTSSWGAAFEGQKFGKSSDSKNNFYLRKTFELEAGKTYVWELATRSDEGFKHVMNVLPNDVYPTMECTNSSWKKHSIEFTVVEGNTTVTLSLYRWPAKSLYFDNFILKEKVAGTATTGEVVVKENNFIVFPNPVRDRLNILHVNGNSHKKEKVIFNLQGNRMMVINEGKSLNVSSLPPGVYFIRCDNQVVRFVKS